jgi:hypothetical protein
MVPCSGNNLNFFGNDFKVLFDTLSDWETILKASRLEASSPITMIS